MSPNLATMPAVRRPLPQGIPIAPGPDGVRALLEALPRALDRGDTIAPYPVGGTAHHHAVRRALGLEDAASPLEFDDIAVILATSGSTGDPLGVMHTRGSILASANGQRALRPFDRGCAWLCALPVASAGGFQTVLRAYLAGVTEPEALACTGGSFAAHEIAPAVARLRERAGSAAVATSLVPAQVHRCLADAAATEALASLDAVLCGGSATPRSLMEKATSHGIRLIPTYGMTETGGGVVYDGVPFPSAQVSIAPGGELLIGGDVVARGYRLRPEETRQRFEDGVFRTRDAGQVVEGHVSVIGRLDDIVQVRGTNVSLGAIEQALGGQPGVSGAAVIAVPDDADGSRLIAFVIGSVDAGRAESHVREALGSAAVPAEIRGADSLPMLPNGKIDRRALAAGA